MKLLADLDDSAAARFYEELENGRFMTTRCPACDYTFFPPRVVCPRCLGGGLEWVRQSGRGTVYAFSRQHYALAHRKPEVVGVVEMDGVEGRVFTVIDAPFDGVGTGMPVEVELFRSGVFGITLHRFSPIEDR